MTQRITKHQRHRASGFTLVELMIASTLGLLVVGTVMYLFLSSKLAFSETARLGAINENGRYAMSVLTDELRLVEFWGQTRFADISDDPDLVAIGTDCVGDLDALNNGFANGYGHANALWATTVAAATVAVCITDATANSDVIFIKHVAGTPTPLANLVANRNYLMSNDSKGVLFNQADASPPTNSVGGDVPGGTAWEYVTTAYYVRTVAGEPPTLYRKRLNGNTWEDPGQEVAVGVERLHLQFGIDNDNDAVANFFVNSANVAAAWGSVVSVRLFLLVRSETGDPRYTDEKTYQLGNVAFGGVAYTPNDNFYRTLFDTSVALRNRRLLITGGF